MDSRFLGVVSSPSEPAGGHWFHAEKVHDWLYLIREMNFFEGNRCNIWLIKGFTHDVIIDTGLGVCDLNEYLTQRGLIHRNNRPCIVICTHCHFDHAGGAHHFTADPVYIHANDAADLRSGRQRATLNYVKLRHFVEQPYPGFSARRYRVPPTPCQELTTGQVFNISDPLEIVHVPGHTKGSIAVYYAARWALFCGDFVYECGNGSALIDWLPTSSVSDYIRSADTMSAWFANHPEVTVYPGHFSRLAAERARGLLQQYTRSKEDCGDRCFTKCMQLTTGVFFCCGCFRCCAC